MKTIAFALCAALMLGFTACGQPAESPETDGTAITDTTQIPNPWHDYDSLSDACGAAGFDFVIPESIEGSEGIRFSVMGDGEIIEAVFGEDDSEVIIRKAPGTDDISGDYNTYESCEKVTAGDIEATFKGDGEKVNLATWTLGDYTYSVMARSGLPADTMTAMVSTIR